jgi:predicted homoserine dehydrogenase-like protein
MKHGEKTMVEGFFAAQSINSCEDVEGFKGYAASLDEAEKLYA